MPQVYSGLPINQEQPVASYGSLALEAHRIHFSIAFSSFIYLAFIFTYAVTIDRSIC